MADLTAKFTRVVQYAVTARCRTPLRTGGTENDSEFVLCRWDGRAIIQAASLAGAFRDWLISREKTALAEELFGSQERGSELILTDGEFEETALQQLRPRVALDGKTGAAEEGKKFDMAHIAKGAKFSFVLTLLCTEETEQPHSAGVEELLAALHRGYILLGGQKSNGFGRTELTEVVKTRYDLTQESDRSLWLTESKQGDIFDPGLIPMAVSVYGRNRVTFTLSGTVDGLLIRAAADENTGERDTAVNIRENNIWVIPGASVKGAVRGRAEMIDGYLKLGGLSRKMFGCEDDTQRDGKAGELRFEDGYLTCKPREISRVRIDRFTGGVMEGALFSEKPLFGRLKLTVTVPDEGAKCALLLLALRDLGLGLYSLGSGGSIGRGYLSDVSIDVNGQPMLRFEKNTLVSVQQQELSDRWMAALSDLKRGGGAE